MVLTMALMVPFKGLMTSLYSFKAWIVDLSSKETN